MNLSSFFPTVVGYEPNIETEEVDSLPLIEIRFSVDLDSSQINTDAKLAGFIILTEEVTESTIAVEYVDYANRVLSFKPATALTEGNYYRVTVMRGIPSFDGRTMQFNHVFVFKVTANDIPAPVLMLPGNDTSHTTNPTFQWYPITYTTDQILNYHVQVDTSTGFNTIGESGWETTSIACTGMPGTALTQDTSYYWRVRAELVSGSITYYGDWSEVRTFYLGTSLQPSLSVQQTYAEADSFHLDVGSIDDGLSHQTTFPSLWFMFSGTVNSSTLGAVSMVRESVDGYPSSAQTAVSITATCTDSTVTITVNDAIVQNNKYTITFSTTLADTSGNALSEKVTTYFTSTYSPLYVAAIVLRADFGSFLVDYPDDLLNFYLYRTSLELNRYVLTYTDQDPSEDSIRTDAITLTAPMLRWMEHKTAAKLLTMRFYELLEDADRLRKLGDYTEQRGSAVLGAIQAARKKEEQEAQYWFSQFSLRRARPRPVVKSANWDPSFKYADNSFQHLIRDF